MNAGKVSALAQNRPTLISRTLKPLVYEYRNIIIAREVYAQVSIFSFAKLMDIQGCNGGQFSFAIGGHIQRQDDRNPYDEGTDIAGDIDTARGFGA